MKRREFLKTGAVGGAITATAGLAATHEGALAAGTTADFELVIDWAPATMIDGTVVPWLTYFLGGVGNAEMRVREGQRVSITITNNDTQPHSFYIPGMVGSRVPTVMPGESATKIFRALNPGTYLYLDPLKPPLNRVLGLHGAFIVDPLDGRTANNSETPFSTAQHTRQVQAIFDAMGTHWRFPGDKWRAADDSRERLWLWSQIDPSLNERVKAGEDVDPATVRGSFLPRYFTINGLSGFDAAVHDEANPSAHPGAARISPIGRQGEPCLIRALNAGITAHAMHIHGNHFMRLTETPLNGVPTCTSYVLEQDVILIRPLDRIEMLLPFERPPDIPRNRGLWPPKEEPWPLRYVMHCHFEISQTAGGGNYPQGAVTHWAMTSAITSD